MGVHVLFVCTGNTCRSPMAEGLLRQIADEAGFDVDVKSAGIHALPGIPYAENARTVLSERGVRADGEATAVDAQLLQWADIVLVMTFSHKCELIKAYPDYVDKIHVLKEFVETDPAIEERKSQLHQLYAELAVKRVQFQAEHRKQKEGEPLPEAIRQVEARIRQLERELPDIDIADPVGGTLADYRRCADELESTLRRLVEQLKRNDRPAQ